MKKLLTKYPRLAFFPITDFNRKVFNFYKKHVSDEKALLTSLVQMPFVYVDDLDYYKENFGEEVFTNVSVLNSMFDMDESLHFRYEELWPMIFLYLSNYVFLFEEEGDGFNKSLLMSRDIIEYALSLLEFIDIFELRSVLEDRFFQFLEPNVFASYKSVLSYTKDNYIKHRNAVMEKLGRLLKQKNIKAALESRVKTIYSIHRKIIRKNILFSQILDTVGIRFLVENVDDCYRIMNMILQKYPVLSSKVKDYIALPKTNGYQSIHLTVIIDKGPVEIQIRTNKMHDVARFGSAAHRLYKNEKS